MKKLISESDILEAKRQNAPIYADETTIITALARDAAKDLGVEIIASSEENKASSFTRQVRASEEITCTSKGPSKNDPVFSASEIYNFLNCCIDKGILNEKDLLDL